MWGCECEGLLNALHVACRTWQAGGFRYEVCADIGYLGSGSNQDGLLGPIIPIINPIKGRFRAVIG